MVATAHRAENLPSQQTVAATAHRAENLPSQQRSKLLVNASTCGREVEVAFPIKTIHMATEQTVATVSRAGNLPSQQRSKLLVNASTCGHEVEVAFPMRTGSQLQPMHSENPQLKSSTLD